MKRQQNLEHGRLRWWVALLGIAFFPSCQPFRKCDPVNEARLSELPERLSMTGLYVAGSVEALAPDVREYRPRFELWSDGAEKRRFVFLPPGARIDSSDMDAWQFPVGTKLWKEFSRDDVRVETRLLQRLESGWLGVAYLWQDDSADAFAAPYGAIDARGTPHNVPAANECEACHGGRSSYALGFSAVQLAQPREAGSLSLDDLALAEQLTRAPTTTPRVPGNETEQEALGYLHANCSHCHNASRPPHSGSRCFDPENDLDFSLRADDGPDPAQTSTYRTANGDGFEPGHPDDSKLIELVQQRSRFRQMPPLATELVDPVGVALLRRWIEEM